MHRVSKLGQMTMGFCVVLLALSIFGWGLHSKLSLYSSITEAQASTPVAKLLSEQERPADHQTQVVQPEPIEQDAFISVAPLTSLSLPVDRFGKLDTASPVTPTAFTFDGPSSLRPPPFPIA